MLEALFERQRSPQRGEISMKKQIQKLTLSRETLCRLEEMRLQTVAGDAGTIARTRDSVCQCPTDLCVSLGYTGCTTCNS
jgi:hypothetical protein